MINRFRFHFVFCSVLAVTGVMLAGCGKQEPNPTTPAQPAVEAPAVETPSIEADVSAAAQAATETVTETVAAAKDELARLVQAFEKADAATLANVQKAVGAVREGNYADALPLLQQVAGQANLTSDQTNLLQGVIDMVTKKMAEASAEKAIGDVQKSLPFGQ